MATFRIVTKDTALLTALAAGAIAAGDSVYIDQYAINHTPADLSATDLFEVNLTEGFSGTFSAAAGAQLKVTANRTSTGTFRNFSNSPRVELISTSGAGVIHTIINAPRSSGVMWLNTATATNLVHGSGELYVEDGATVTNLYVQGGNAYLRNSSNVTALVATGNRGTVVVERDITDARIGGGSTVVLNHISVAPAGVVTLNGGTLQVNRCGTVASIAGETGVIDFRPLQTPITVTGTALHPGVTILHTQESRRLVTVTTPADLFGGPKIVTQN